MRLCAYTKINAKSSQRDNPENFLIQELIMQTIGTPTASTRACVANLRGGGAGTKEEDPGIEISQIVSCPKAVEFISRPCSPTSNTCSMPGVPPHNPGKAPASCTSSTGCTYFSWSVEFQ